jgi:hypothetical protein
MLPAVRCSFLTLGEPDYYGGEKAKPTDKRRWSATALVPANSELRKKVDEAVARCAKEKWPDKWKTILENQIMTDPKACCWVNGERKDYDGYQGMWALSAHRYEDKGRPLVFDKLKHPVYHTISANGYEVNDVIVGKEGVIYSGCMINMHIELWAQQNANGKGVRATLLGVQKFGEGDSFGGGVRPDEGAFGAIEDGADAGSMDEAEAGLG